MRTIQVDRNLSTWWQFWAAVTIFTLVYKLVIFQEVDLFSAAVISMFTVWIYKSSRKYGFMDTILFLTVLPIKVCVSLVSFLDKNRINREPISSKFYTFGMQASKTIGEVMNKAYEGKVLSIKFTEGYVYVMAETPFGLNIPEDEIIRDAARELHLKRAFITYERISDNRGYYIFSDDAFPEYYRKQFMDYSPLTTFSGLKNRFLCTSEVHLNPRSPSG